MKSEEERDSNCTDSVKSGSDLLEKKKIIWSDEEDGKFIEALFKVGKCYRKIAEYVGTKSKMQCREHAYKMRKELKEDPTGNEELLKALEQEVVKKWSQDDVSKFMSIIKEAGQTWRKKRCWLKMPERRADQFISYYAQLYQKALKNKNTPDAEFIIENYKGTENSDRRKWTEDEIIQFNELIRSAGKYWRKRQVWNKMKNRTYGQFNARYSMIYKQAQLDETYPDREFILNNFLTSSGGLDANDMMKFEGKSRWTVEDHQKFLKVAQKVGQDWRWKAHLEIPNKTQEQVRMHYRQYYLKCKQNPLLPGAQVIMANYYLTNPSFATQFSKNDELTAEFEDDIIKDEETS